MKKKLPEGYIKKKALQFLQQSYYRRCPINGIIYKELEAYTNEGKRADGLIMFRQKGRNPFVASLEAKSANTLRSLVEQMDLARMVDDGLKMAVFSFAFIWSLAWMVGVRQVLDPILALLMGGCWIWMVKGYIATVQPLALSRHTRIGALEQLKQYPADERWLAIGIDSIAKEDQFHRLLQHCRKTGIGLLIVSSDGSVEVHVHPKFSTRSDVTDYSQFYKNAPLALKRITKRKKQSGFGKPTRAQFRYRLQLYSIVGASLLFCLLFLLPPLQEYEPLYKQDTVPSHRSHPASYSTSSPTPESPPASSFQEELLSCHYLSFTGRRLLLVDQFYAEPQAATRRVAQLKAIGFTKADYFWLPCYENSQQEDLYCVHPYDPRVSRDRIAHQKRRYEYLTRLHDLAIGTPLIISIEKPR
ncbi:MAG: hypothetical protein KTR30_03100 [Saprospiraceae bacterium]|nr:hypothetical protein [Saprospiraceae bacterium]